MSDVPNRPTWNTIAVMEEAASLIYGEVRTWAEGLKVIPEGTAEEDIDKGMLAIVTLAVLESACAYEAGRYLETFCDWPTNSELIRILDRCYLSMPRVADSHVRGWVMEHAVRFPAKEGDQIVFKLGDAELRGTCVGAVATEARGWVELAGSKRGNVVPVCGEDVIKITKPKAAPGGSPVPPVGGTPIAPRGGALLKEAKVA